MLPYETARHAKSMFARWVSVSLTQHGLTPSETEIRVFAEAAASIAEEFAAASERYVSQISAKAPNSSRSSPIRKSLTFEDLLYEWQSPELMYWRQSEKATKLQRFHRYLLPSLGSRPAEDIKPLELVAALRLIEAEHCALAHVLARDMDRMYRFAVASGFALHNPAEYLRDALRRHRPQHRRTILDPKRIGELLRAIDCAGSYGTSKYLLRLMPLLFVRLNELRKAEWNEIDLQALEWRIPARRMKGRRSHIVPLSFQAARLFRQLHRLSGNGTFVFPSDRSKDGIISEFVCLTKLRTIGFGNEITMSGFRSMAATLLRDQGWSSDAIEKQLSHADSNPARRAYNFAEYLPERRRMMQAWADYLDWIAGRIPSVRKAFHEAARER